MFRVTAKLFCRLLSSEGDFLTGSIAHARSVPGDYDVRIRAVRQRLGVRPPDHLSPPKLRRPINATFGFWRTFVNDIV